MATSRSLRKARRRTLEKAARGWGRFYLKLCALVFYPCIALLTRTRVRGLENIPATGPALLVLNHVSHLDPLYDSVTVHRAGRIPRFLAKNTLWNIPVVGHVLRGVEQIPVYRGTADAGKSLQDAYNALDEGKVILIYPDGTITKDPDGWPMTPKVGVARLALERDVPIVPVARWGTRAVYDHYQKKFRPLPRKDVRIAIGEPIDLSEFRGRTANATLQREAAKMVMSRVRDLLGEVREEQPPSEFYSPNKTGTRGDDA